MARNIQEINDLLRFIIRKQRNVFITISEGDNALDAGQLDTVTQYFKLYGINQQIHDALKPFKIYKPFTSDAGGAVSFESDYLHLLAGVFTVTGSTVNRVRFVETDEFPDAITGQLRPVALSSPIAIDTSNGFQLYPQSQQTGAYNYIRRPATPLYSYTQVGRTITYDSATSVQLEWSDVYIDGIIAKALKYYGINMAENEIIQFAEILDKETS